MSITSFFGSGAAAKRPRQPEDTPQPRTLCAWNANSLLNRIEKDGAALQGFLKTHSPDIIFVGEVRMPAAGPPGCKKDDGKPRRRGELSRGNAAQSREADAIGSFLREHGYRAYWSLSDSKYAGTGLLVRRDLAQPSQLRYNLGLAAPSAQHTQEGRVIIATFDEFELLGTYAPNNGTTESSLERRRKWDAEMTLFVSAPRERPLVWLGDLNVAAEWGDVGPSPEWFRSMNGQDAAEADDRGQPGFTANEQRRFASIIKAGALVDAYRLLHRSTDVTWRGTPGTGGVPEAGRYYGKGMRIDYVMVQEALVPRVSKAVVLGQGAMRAGFLGSDHCPLLVELASKSPAADEASSSDGPATRTFSSG